MDGDDEIEFNEWCKATMNKRKVLGRTNLKKAFDQLDLDGNGTIDYNEIKTMFKSDISPYDREFNQFMKEIDINGDGEIDYKEFERMMGKFLIGNMPKPSR